MAVLGFVIYVLVTKKPRNGGFPQISYPKFGAAIAFSKSTLVKPLFPVECKGVDWFDESV
jgi:hypothetical protein